MWYSIGLDGIPELSRIFYHPLSLCSLAVTPPEPDAQSQDDQHDEKVTPIQVRLANSHGVLMFHVRDSSPNPWPIQRGVLVAEH